MPAEQVKEAAPVLLSSGTMLCGRYRIERYLGGGGMAFVYRAVHVGLDQPVAIKVVSSRIRDVPGVAERFTREARAATKLKSEHVVRVFDVGTADDGSPFLAMDLLEGKDLGEMIDEGFRPSVEEAIEYALQACEALAEVHGLGIVHRDLKPANIFVTRGPDGLACLKLIDFGISRVDSPLLPKDTVALTSPDVVMGSPRYMPPEQMESAAAADARSDIWGLGAILYELLTGKAPFDGDSILDIYTSVLAKPPPSLSAVLPDAPRGLDEVLMRCLRVDPKDRYATVADLAAALAPFGDDGAAARAESIARVLETSRARGNGEADASGAVGTGGRSVPSSRIRRRRKVHSRLRTTAVVLASVALTAIGFMARPMLHIPGTATATSVSASTATTTETISPPAPEPAPVVVTGADLAQPPVAEADESADAGAAPPKTIAQPTAHARWIAPQPRARAAAVPALAATPAEPSTDVVKPSVPEVEPPPAPPPATPTPPARADDRTLFEERK